MTEAAIVTGTPAVVDSGRGRFAATIVIGHALKHTLTSGLPSVDDPGDQARPWASARPRSAPWARCSRSQAGWRRWAPATWATVSRRRRGSCSAFSLAITGVGSADLSLAPGYGVLLLAMLFMGFGPSMFHPPAVGALSRRFADRRSFAISLHGTGGSVGEALGPLVAAGLLALLFWRDALRVEFLPAIVGARSACGACWHDEAPQQRAGQPSLRDLHRVVPAAAQAPDAAADLPGHGLARRWPGGDFDLPADLPARGPGLLVGCWSGLYIAMAQLAGIGSQPLMGYLSTASATKP